MFAPGLLTGKRILITGGGSGLGEVMARRFAGLGAGLVLVGRRSAMLERVAADIARETGRAPDVEPCDIRDAAMVEAMFERVWAQAPIDVLVNNAAANFIARTEELSPRAADAILGPTLHGALYCTLAAGKRWINAQRAGTILSILSTSTLTGRAFTVPSAMAKAGLLAMTRSLAVEWGPRKIRTVAIAPGPFPTAGAQAQLRAGREEPSYVTTNPLGRAGEHGELADLASYLVSERAAYINGEMIVIDGGMHLRASGAEDLLAWPAEKWAALREHRTGAGSGSRGRGPKAEDAA